MKSKIVQYILLLLIGSYCYGCSPGDNITKVMQSWVGSHYSDLMLSWGPPTFSTSDGKGGQILVYQFNREGGQIPGFSTKIGKTLFYTAPQNISYTAERMFYVDENGIIYFGRWKGL
jgi:hypothetical protein